MQKEIKGEGMTSSEEVLLLNIIDHIKFPGAVFPPCRRVCPHASPTAVLPRPAEIVGLGVGAPVVSPAEAIPDASDVDHEGK